MPAPTPSTTPLPIPPGFRDLVNCPPIVALTTLMPDGSPQTSVVWCDFDGTFVRVSTMRGFRKEKNMRADPRVTLLSYDPANTLRYLEVRGTVVEMTEDGAMAHLDGLSLRYVGVASYFGGCIPETFRETEAPVLCRIAPTHIVTLDCPKDEAPGAEGPAPARADREPGRTAEPEQPARAEPSGGPEPAAEVPIPQSHRDLLTRPIHGVLTTLEPDGQPQSSLVWVDLDRDTAVVNTTRQRRKGRNLARDPRLSLLVVDPANTSRFIQIRGLADCREDGAIEHLDRLTRKYTRHPRYYGYVYPDEQRARETRIVVRIEARRVTLDAIHA